MRLAVLFHRFGPYHIARLSAAAKLGDLVGIELSGCGGEYAWNPVATEAFPRLTICPEGDTNTLVPAERVRRIESALEEQNPDALGIAGYSDPGMLSATRWGLLRGKRLILMSDSQYHDEPRIWWKEWIKRRLVRCFGSGFVAGSTHKDYLVTLGMQREKIFTGYDVVDNEYFAQGANSARNDPAIREKLGLPRRYFFASARFVPKKNLPGLLEAYANYRTQCTHDPWELVIAGDGPLRRDLDNQIRRLGISSYVRLPGFLQYEELPAYYGLASVFVLPSLQDQWGLVVNEAMAAGLPVMVSNVCGCATDLVQVGKNGFVFSSQNIGEFSKTLTSISANWNEIIAMGLESQKIISRWSTSLFARNIWLACDHASETRSSVARTLLASFIHCLSSRNTRSHIKR